MCGVYDAKARKTTYAEVGLWDVATGKERATLKGYSEGVTSVAFSPDGMTLATGSYDDTIKLWDTTAGKGKSATLKGHTSAVESVAFAAKSNILASGGMDQTVRLWDTVTGLKLRC